MKNFLIVALLLGGSCVFGQSLNSEERCSSSAILKAGERRDAASLALLKKLLTSGECPESNHELRLALAKRGDPKRLRDVICSIYAAPEQVADDIGYVGGWFGIRAALLLLEQEESYYASPRLSSDAMVAGSPRSWGLALLRTLVKKNRNVRAPSESTFAPEDAERVWRKWIAAHKPDLQRLSPTGSSVSFQPCNTE